MNSESPFDEFQADSPPAEESYAPPAKPGTGRSHRGGFILAMGIISLVASLGGIVMCCCILGGVFPLLGLATGITAFFMGRVDVAAMNRGEMDAGGRGQTQTGMYLGLAGAIVGLLLLIGYVLLVAFGMASDLANQRANF